MSDSPITVLIADDHPVVRDGLALLLGSLPEFEVVASVDTAEAAVRAAVERHPDVVLMDLVMPLMGGIRATARITADAPGVRILILTTHEDISSIVEAIGAGAGGYVLKTVGIGEISAAIRAVHHGQLVFSSDISPTTRTQLLTGRAPASRPFPDLTDREFAVLDHLASGATTLQIAERLGLSGKTVSNHLSTVYVKLGVATRTEAALLASSQGLGGEGAPVRRHG